MTRRQSTRGHAPWPTLAVPLSVPHTHTTRLRSTSPTTCLRLVVAWAQGTRMFTLRHRGQQFSHTSLRPLQCLLAWDPTPSAPDLFREELISNLANECNARPTDDDFLAGLQTLSASFAEDQVAELEAVQESDAPGTSDRSPSCDSTNERRQESNRQAQKRWRSRQKVLLGQELQH